MSQLIASTMMRSLQLSLAAFALCQCSAAGAQPQWRFENVERFVAVADIHGAYDAFEAILLKAEIIDDSLQWTGGDSHLVIAGDVLDRGPDSRAALDLIMQLQESASDAGGAVHLVLGNHELMNLTGDLRYVAPEEYAAFAADETPAMRSTAMQRFTGTQEAFDADFPPGFFAHREAFSANGRYGSWLLQRPFLLVINDWAFVHGGLAAASRDLIAADLNADLSEQLRSYTVALDVLVSADVLGPGDNFYDHPGLLQSWSDAVAAGQKDWPEATQTAANIVAELNSAFAFNTESPSWYRGNVGCNALIESDRLAATLNVAGVRHIVVGHTPTRDAQVHSHLSEKLFRIDTGMLDEYYGGQGAALIVEGDTVRAIYENSTGMHTVVAQPRRVGRRPNAMTATELAAFLAVADITEIAKLDDRWSRVILRRDDIELSGFFSRNRPRGIQPDLAAWRLDMALGLDMVPVTVAREVDGEDGTLQYFPAGVITEATRQADGLGASAWCPLGDQFGAMYIFDALIGNTGRTLERLLYSTDNFGLILVGHDASFSTSDSKPTHLAEVPLPLTATWIQRLQSLTEEGLETTLGDVLDRRRIRALLARRDAILADAGVALRQ